MAPPHLSPTVFNSKLIPSFLVLLILLLSSSFVHPSNTKGKLIIYVKGIKNQKGKIRASLYNSEIGFPDTPTSKYLAAGEISKDKARIEIKNLTFGHYAVSLIHDENNDFKLESNIFGIPKEGVGISNNVKGLFGPPSYDQAKFHFSKNNQVININLVYY